MRRQWVVSGLICLALTWAAKARAADFLTESALADEGPVSSSPCGCDASPLCDSCRDCESYECCDSFNGRQRLLGLFLPSDHCFDRFVSPLSNPFFFEDPRSLTEARGLFLDNSLPGFTGGGDVQAWAAQFRGRVTDRVSVIAPRLSYLQVNQPGQGAPVGFLSAPIGAKWNFVRDVDRQLLVTAGITYFIPGSRQAFSSFGDGDFHFFLTAGKEIFERGHWLSGTGFRIPANNNFGTQLWYWSNQWDYELPNHFYPLVGVNWFHWMRSSNLNLGAPVTGLDLINIPTTGVAGTDVVTGLAGLKWKPNGNVEVGGGYEFPMSDRTDILRNRVYADVIFRY